MTVYRQRCPVTGEEHSPLLWTDCGHCQRILDLARRLVDVVCESGISPREMLITLNMATEMTIDHLVAPSLGPSFYGGSEPSEE